MTAGRLVVIEINTTGSGERFLEVAEQIGLAPVLVTSDPGRYCLRRARPLVVEADTSSADEVLRACRAHFADEPEGVLTASDHFVVIAAQVASRLGLAHNPVPALERTRHKGWQRRALRDAAVEIPRFAEACRPEQAASAAAAIGLPVVVKPVTGSGSIGVKLCASLDEVVEHAAQLLARSTNERGQRTPRAVLVEAVAPGLELSVETFGHAIVGITEKHLGRPPHFVEVGHDYPATLDRVALDIVGSTAIAALAALGLRHGPAHVEVRLHNGLARVIEVNARLAGGMIPRLVELASGVDLVRETIRTTVGEEPCLRAAHRRHASIRFVLGADASPDATDAAAAVAALDGVVECEVKQPSTVATGDFRDRAGYVITCAADDDQARSAATAALEQLLAPSPTVGGTGRLTTTASPAVRRMLFGEHGPTGPDRAEELSYISTVDMAHVVMLTERGVVPRTVGAALLRAIVELRASGFAEVLRREAPRGTYLAYERHLIETLGEDVGGVLHTGRSRNDLSATCFALSARTRYLDLSREMLRLSQVLLGRARRHAVVTMPAFTHFQPAVPITYGHYLLGVAVGAASDFDALTHAVRSFDRSPLGAGAVGGTTVPIDTERTAKLLGFAGPVHNSVHAVADRSGVLRLLAAAASLGVTLDRVALDLLLWSSQEISFLAMPDGVVGSSSMMPQKRNVFVLEHVLGKTAASIGSFVSAASAMRGTSYTNSIAVGTEATSHLWPALAETCAATRLLRLAVAGARPLPDVMARRADDGMTAATAVSERLAAAGVPFRRAHYMVGAATGAVADGRFGSLKEAVRATIDTVVDDDAFDARAAAVHAEHGGGPGPASFQRGWAETWATWRRLRETHNATVRRWREAETALWCAVDELTGGREGSRHRKEEA